MSSLCMNRGCIATEKVPVFARKACDPLFLRTALIRERKHMKHKVHQHFAGRDSAALGSV